MATAQSKGIPILINGTPQEYGFSGPRPGVTFDAIDYRAQGRGVGDQLGTCITSKLGGNAKVFFATETDDQAGKKEKEGAALAALKAAAPTATVVSTITAKDRSQSQKGISAALQGHPDTTALMSMNDEGLLGGLSAFATAGKQLGCAVDSGGNDKVVALATSGEVYATVALKFEADTKQSFDTLVKMQTNPKANGLVLTVPQQIVSGAAR